MILGDLKLLTIPEAHYNGLRNYWFPNASIANPPRRSKLIFCEIVQPLRSPNYQTLLENALEISEFHSASIKINDRWEKHTRGTIRDDVAKIVALAEQHIGDTDEFRLGFQRFYSSTHRVQGKIGFRLYDGELISYFARLPDKWNQKLAWDGDVPKVKKKHITCYWKPDNVAIEDVPSRVQVGDNITTSSENLSRAPSKKRMGETGPDVDALLRIIRRNQK